ncbi:putative dehydrogenase [Parabacteroides sp. PF5-5]|uniref:Gfo/Idh/MocA family protein n=1 Tax=unclassified Parabacteroides TaxID=2649774 RepID=UPI0024758C53|nr:MULTISPECIES: Gfo/Idh/MocA family oxidoreductase [unclassified Parabacteroides]MDH6305434.1 putative dehydrogenase [Parabacteroides sp. PH5-39]MDH6316144.1 putative dehydrogenase [Parabacteroides sp. PF5-13]MDH6320294.1 putative dehydrogenase [Parabacteroides sp. PH5-13]MDH6324024.1 putative dehydrogenase [Parabacteroides sp. PH5-8]MDH6327335.1 putative dehydrogenase [Parabacteroides sp. PH5-41]
MNTRRNFIKKSGLAAAGLYILPSKVISGLGHRTPSDKLNIVGIGIGGKGHPNLVGMNTENIIGLCDVDWKYADHCFKEFPDAKRYKDWRRMFDEMGKDIDGVMIATPDHTHAMIAAQALMMDKHVYCQKPLTHSIYESRLLTKLAAKHKVATQMGHQGNSGNGVRQLCEWIWNGEIGEIREVHAWTDRPLWPQGLQRPTNKVKVPSTLDWDLFLGPAPWRPYNPVYTPWNWRGWWDFGTGAFGDMGCHVLDPIYQSLKLGYPTQIQGSSSEINTESPPQSEIVEFRFPARDNLPKVMMPEVKVHWYDGGLMPNRPDILPDGTNLMPDGLGGCLFVGSKDTILTECGGYNPRLLSGRVPNVPQTLRRVPGATGYHDGYHEQDWVRACKESPANRVETTGNFAYAGPFNEMVLLGVLAIRLQGLRKILNWDGENMRFTNISPTEELRIISKNEFTIRDGHPYSDVKYEKFNALEAVTEYIKHNYREGWSLPSMP